MKIKKGGVVGLVLLAVLIGMGRIIFSQEQAKDLKYFGVNYRDPFLSFLPEEKIEEKLEKIAPPNLKLQGIVWGGDKPRAIINNTVLGKGDEILGAKILEIKKEGISFIYKGQDFLLERGGTIKVQGGTE